MTSRFGMRCVRAALLVPVLAVGVASLTLPATAVAQVSAAQARKLDGTVMGSGGNPLSGAVVYLKNTNTLAIKTYVADGEGAFHFGQLGTEGDFQVWAEYGGRKSNVKTVSAMQSKKSFDVQLKIDTAK